MTDLRTFARLARTTYEAAQAEHRAEVAAEDAEEPAEYRRNPDAEAAGFVLYEQLDGSGWPGDGHPLVVMVGRLCNRDHMGGSVCERWAGHDGDCD